MAKRIAISMPEPLFKDMERARKREGKDRSAWMQDAVSERLRQKKRKEDAAAYVRSYQEQPETDEETAFVEAALKLGPLHDDEWPEAPR